MKIGSENNCSKRLLKIVKRQNAEIKFLKDYMKRFEALKTYRRVPDEEAKKRLIEFLERDFELPLERKLQLISIRKSRFYSWRKKKNQGRCLSDLKSCPGKIPAQLTFSEIENIRRLVGDNDLSDMSLSSLYWVGRRENKINFSITTWFKYIRKYNMLDGLPGYSCTKAKQEKRKRFSRVSSPSL